MNAQEFCYWLRGYLELSGDNTRMSFSEEQVEMLRSHLNLVFTKITPTPQLVWGSGWSSGGSADLNTKHTGLSSRTLC